MRFTITKKIVLGAAFLLFLAVLDILEQTDAWARSSINFRKNTDT